MPKIFLSPSTQQYNQFVDGSGSEEYYMNLIADAMVPYLLANGIDFVRNSTEWNVSQSIAQSNAGRYDLHLALHSNASPDHLAGQLQGPDIYYNPDNRQSRRFADILAENLHGIYPYHTLIDVRPSSQLIEVRRTTAPSVLVETAYHDNPEDALWIRENIEGIARVLVLSLTEYFGLPFLQPTASEKGKVKTSGGPLLLRNFPNTGAPVLARMQDGAPLTVYNRLPNGWFVVGYGDQLGFASGDYIVPR